MRNRVYSINNCRVGSGTVIQSVLSHFSVNHNINAWVTDINPFALENTIKCINAVDQNTQKKFYLSLFKTSLFNGLSDRLKFDLIYFNPPYVPSPKPIINFTECSNTDYVDASWAGGIDGCYWIDLFLQNANSHLNQSGTAYVLCLNANKIEALCSKAKLLGLLGEVFFQNYVDCCN